MWKKITDYGMVSEIEIGNLVTDEPNSQVEFYEVKSIHEGVVKVVHANGRTRIKVFPETELVGNWWIKK